MEQPWWPFISRLMAMHGLAKMFSTGNDPNDQLQYCIKGAYRFYVLVSLCYLVFRSDLKDRIRSFIAAICDLIHNCNSESKNGCMKFEMIWDSSFLLCCHDLCTLQYLWIDSSDYQRCHWISCSKLPETDYLLMLPVSLLSDAASDLEHHDHQMIFSAFKYHSCTFT
jgi:hypothetical protein